ncbi:CBY1-interacting BAR domain-containing protein 1-B isoform X2 [Procambarus clarkii]|uniref:CBY1-interacting BAR domain-containing protein 1-B isoform X2 n=1 Tax=Procambarus clarkii TaxID=6728 RepID=UPI001E672223|nr:protein FAM92A-B-like isoform X2 [Procambarus clarkii]
MFSSNSLSKVHSNQARFIQERISGVEKHFGQICNALGSYTRKTAKLRDRGDVLSKTLLDYGEVENLNKSLRSALCDTADTLAAVQDYRNVQVERLETRVVGEIALYGGICKAAREELKRSFDTRQQEINHRRDLEKTKNRRPQNRQQIVIAETKHQKATAEAKRACQNLEEQMDQFEQKKVADLKKVLREFVQTELAFHAKALELYTKAYNQISNIEEEEDLEEFRNALKGNAAARAEVVGAGQGSSLSPVINSVKGKKKESHRKRDMNKSIEKLQIEDYEEINESTSSEDD